MFKYAGYLSNYSNPKDVIKRCALMSYPEESSGCVLEEEDDKISLTFCDISQPTSETRFKVQILVKKKKTARIFFVCR